MHFHNISQIHSLIQAGEGQSVELKKTTGQLNRAMETLCAFLNGSGGTVLFGVSDKGEIIGQEVGDDTRRSISEVLCRFTPSVTPDISYIPVPDSDKFIIAVNIESTPSLRPFFYNHVAYRRIESTTVPLPEDALADMMMVKGGNIYVWEGMPAVDYSIDMLDHKLIRGAVGLGVRNNRIPESVETQTIEEILRGFHLITTDGKVTNAAVVLFGKDLFPDFPQCLLRLAKFRGNLITDDFIDNRQVHGNIYELVDAAMEFFVKHLNISGTINPITWQREDELDVPRKVLRESIVNACAHRLYHRRGSSIGVAIFNDRIEVTNTGTFPIGVTESSILNMEGSEPFNPLIANVLYRTTYLEHWGRGIRMMRDVCVGKGLKAPHFTTDGHSVKATFYIATEEDGTLNRTNDGTLNRTNDGTLNGTLNGTRNVTRNVPLDETLKVADTSLKELDTSSHTAKDTTKDVTRNVTRNVTRKGKQGGSVKDNSLNADEREKKIIELLKINPAITQEEIADKLNVTRRTVSRHFKDLIAQHRIIREGATKRGKWIVIE